MIDAISTIDEVIATQRRRYENILPVLHKKSAYIISGFFYTY
jgi:hypothetical protein